MRKIRRLVIHCSATMEGKPFTATDIERMHKRPPNAWKAIGYHWVVELDGAISQGRPEGVIGAHVAGHNADSIGVCYIGGIGRDGRPKDTRTAAQTAALAALVREILARHPFIDSVCGHRDLSPDADGDGAVERHEWLKDCPCFDVAAWLGAIGLGGFAIEGAAA